MPAIRVLCDVFINQQLFALTCCLIGAAGHAAEVLMEMLQLTLLAEAFDLTSCARLTISSYMADHKSYWLSVECIQGFRNNYISKSRQSLLRCSIWFSL